MLAQLGERPVVCAPAGGESGQALRGLAQLWQIEIDAVVTASPSPVYVEDRRGGARQAIARSPVKQLTRHDADEL